MDKKKIYDLSQCKIKHLTTDHFKDMDKEVEKIILPKGTIESIAYKCFANIHFVVNGFSFSNKVKNINIEDTVIKKISLSDILFLSLERLILPATIENIKFEVVGIKSLVELDLSRTYLHRIDSGNSGMRALYGFDKLENIIFPTTFRELKVNSIVDCRSLYHLDFSDTDINLIEQNSINGCENLERIVVSRSFKGYIDYEYRHILSYNRYIKKKRINMETTQMLEKINLIYDNKEHIDGTSFYKVEMDGQKFVVGLGNDGSLVKSKNCFTALRVTDSIVKILEGEKYKPWQLAKIVNNQFIYSAMYGSEIKLLQRNYFYSGDSIIVDKGNEFIEKSIMDDLDDHYDFMAIMSSMYKGYIDFINEKLRSRKPGEKNSIRAEIEIIRVRYEIKLNCILAYLTVKANGKPRSRLFYRSVRIADNDVKLSRIYERIEDCSEEFLYRKKIAVVNRIIKRKNRNELDFDRRCLLLDSHLNEIKNTEGYGIAAVKGGKYLKIYQRPNVLVNRKDVIFVDVKKNFSVVNDGGILAELENEMEQTIFGIMPSRKEYYNSRIGDELIHSSNELEAIDI